jgi:amidase
MERNLAAPRNIETSPSDSTTHPDPPNEICFIRATDLAAMIREKKLSAREVMQAHLRQIERVNPKVN